MVSSLEQGIKSGEIKLTAADIDIIRSLHINDGEYSQAYIISENTDYRGVVNMPLSPAMYALLNTSPSQNSRYAKLRGSASTSTPYQNLQKKEIIMKRLHWLFSGRSGAAAETVRFDSESTIPRLVLGTQATTTQVLNGGSLCQG